MYKKILIATDGSDLAGHAVDHGLSLAKSSGASVVFVTVTEAWSALEMADDFEKGKLDAVTVFEETAKRSAETILAAAAKTAEAAGVPAETRHVNDRKPAEGIIDTAELEDCDLIVMATHGHRGLKRMLIGSQTAEVVAFSKRPVLVLH